MSEKTSLLICMALFAISNGWFEVGHIQNGNLLMGITHMVITWLAVALCSYWIGRKEGQDGTQDKER